MNHWPDTGVSAALRQKYATDLALDRDGEWLQAFADVPRHIFVPTFYTQSTDMSWQPVTWGDGGYLEAVYRDAALTTQLDERGVPTSSSSQPSLMLTMLEALDVRDGHRVFELGTGTGYNAALLSHRLGEGHVTSVDVDPGLVAAAISRLRQAGHRPTLAAGDGALGYARRAPYDRLIATAGLHAVPPALLEQAADDAVMVAPLGYGIIRAQVTGPGHATGRFLPTPAHFMALRTSPASPDLDAVRHERPGSTSVAPQDVLERLKFPLSIALPGYTSCSWKDDLGEVTAVGLWTADGSVATVDSAGTVRQSGPRRLWDSVEKLAATFTEDIEIAHDDFRVAITPTRQTVTYREPGGPSWHLPSASR
ncbi:MULTISPECIES: methyltransferase domain-containing protein [unclassified Streptomyces]|uniref:methyltransferase domain-containing protein n=1 Tax=unclassified Streptomyces TaxID=2593676 RepID=UPI0036EC91F5